MAALRAQAAQQGHDVPAAQPPPPTAAPPPAAEQPPAAQQPAQPLPAEPVPTSHDLEPPSASQLPVPSQGLGATRSLRDAMAFEKMMASQRPAAPPPAGPMPPPSQSSQWIMLPGGRRILKGGDQPAPASQQQQQQQQAPQQQQQQLDLLDAIDRGAARHVVKLGAGQDAWDDDFQVPAPRVGATTAAAKAAAATKEEEEDMDDLFGPLMPSQHAAKASAQRGKRGGTAAKPGATAGGGSPGGTKRPQVRKAAAPRREPHEASGGCWAPKACVAGVQCIA